ncbi:MAG: hypothetical protein J6O41_01235 [Clostridia bacterium]|nr:hypothetical protein [Clostridia bacterium]
MNQILSVDNNYGKKKKNSGPVEIKSVTKFFAIALLIFGFFMIGSGSYSMYKNSQDGASTEKPSITLLEGATQDSIILKVTHSKELSSVTYRWNDGEETAISCEGKKKVEAQIEIPSGTNVLNIFASDINGKNTSMQRTYSIEGNIDINIEAEGSGIKVTAKSEEELSYLTYRWDEEEEQRIDINDTKIEQIIDIPRGLHTLTVVVVNANNESETKTQEVEGITKPKLEISADGENFTIKASDDEGIKRIDFIINDGDIKRINLDKVKPLEERKEFEFSYPLSEGENILEVRVYNEKDVNETKKVLFRK